MSKIKGGHIRSIMLHSVIMKVKFITYISITVLVVFLLCETPQKVYGCCSMSSESREEDYSPLNYDLGKNYRKVLAKDNEYDPETYELSGRYALLDNPTPGSGSGANAKDWQVIIAAYLWLAGLNGTIGVGNRTADIDVSFGDIWENFDIGGQAHIEFWWKKWIFFIDPTYIKLTANNKETRIVTATRSEAEVKEFLFEFGAGYRIAEIPLGGSIKSNEFKSWPNLSIDMYGGGRILNIDNELDLTVEAPGGAQKLSASESKAWFDFIVGTRFIFDITENLLLTAKTDIGGFGLGFSSDISWNLVVNIGYELPWWRITPFIGYRVLYIDYRDGSANNRFVYDVWQTGPQVGLAIRF